MGGCRAGRGPGLSIRIGVVVVYLAVFGCNGLLHVAVGAGRAVGGVVKLIAEADQHNRAIGARQAAEERWREAEIAHDYESIVGAQGHVPDEVPPSADWRNWRRERGSVLDAPRPAQ